MADTDNKEVRVQTASEPKPPHVPDAPAPEPRAAAAQAKQEPPAPQDGPPSEVADTTPPHDTTDTEQLDKERSDKEQSDKEQSDKEQSDKAQPDKAQPDKEQSDKEQSDKELAARLKRLERQLRRTVTKTRQVTQRGGARAKATAGPALSKTAAGLRKGSERGGLALGTFYRTRVKPFLSRAAATAASRLNRTALARDYRRFLLLAHRYGPDRTVEQLCFVPTAEHIPLSIVRVPHQLRRSGHDYRPTPRLVFEWAMDLLPGPVERHTFIDYGAGRGRVLLMASHFPFEKVTGAEIAEELANDCRLNIAQYPRSLMKCRDVECEHTSALRLPIPEGDIVFYLNNPFDRSMLERVIAQVVRSYKQDPRALYVVCVDIDADDLFTDTGVFVRIPPSMRQRLRIRAFSPYAIAVYRTIYQSPPEDDGRGAEEHHDDAAAKHPDQHT